MGGCAQGLCRGARNTCKPRAAVGKPALSSASPQLLHTATQQHVRVQLLAVCGRPPSSPAVLRMHSILRRALGRAALAEGRWLSSDIDKLLAVLAVCAFSCADWRAGPGTPRSRLSLRAQPCPRHARSKPRSALAPGCFASPRTTAPASAPAPPRCTGPYCMPKPHHLHVACRAPHKGPSWLARPAAAVAHASLVHGAPPQRRRPLPCSHALFPLPRTALYRWQVAGRGLMQEAAGHYAASCHSHSARGQEWFAGAFSRRP
jgi:hypothetical protein